MCGCVLSIILLLVLKVLSVLHVRLLITEGLSKLNVSHIFILIFKKKEYIKFLFHNFVEPDLTFYDAAGVFYEILSWSRRQA